MSVKITAVAKQLPQFSRETKEIIPFVEQWMVNQDSRFKRKVVKLFEGAAVDKRYSIMDPIEVFTNPSFEARNDIYVREVKKLGYILVFEGNASLVDDQSGKYVDSKISAITAYSLNAGNWKLKADQGEAVELIFAEGTPLKESIAWRGPVVMNTNDELVDTFRDIEEGRFIKE
jgi:hypothetical protein